MHLHTSHDRRPARSASSASDELAFTGERSTEARRGLQGDDLGGHLDAGAIERTLHGTDPLAKLLVWVLVYPHHCSGYPFGPPMTAVTGSDVSQGTEMVNTLCRAPIRRHAAHPPHLGGVPVPTGGQL